MQKEIIRMNYVDDRDCEEFYYKAGVNYFNTNVTPKTGIKTCRNKHRKGLHKQLFFVEITHL